MIKSIGVFGGGAGGARAPPGKFLEEKKEREEGESGREGRKGRRKKKGKRKGGRKKYIMQV